MFSVEECAEGLPGRLYAVTTITAGDAFAPPAPAPAADGSLAGWFDSDQLPAGWQWITGSPANDGSSG